MILPKVRDPRFITVRRGGTLVDSDHLLLALWAAACAEHVLHHFEAVRPDDPRPRRAIDQARAWVRGEVTMSEARTAAGGAQAAARDLTGAARHAAYAAGQAAAVAHVAAHELGAAAYAIKAARAAAPGGQSEEAGWRECAWQREQLPDAIRELVLDDHRLRNDICWSAFDCSTTHAYTSDDLHEALRPVASLISKSEKAQSKLAPGTWQHAMLRDNLKALRQAYALMNDEPEAAADFSRDDLRDALRAVASMIDRTEKAGAKFSPGTSHHTLQRNRLKALRVAQALLETEVGRGDSAS